MTPLPGRAALPELLPIRGARRERARRHAQEEDCRRGGVDDEVLEAWEKDVVRENERVLVVRERAWKGKKARQQCFGGGGDLEGREQRDWERERTAHGAAVLREACGSERQTAHNVS